MLEFLQKTALNIICLGGEYATNLIIANVETLSHDDINSRKLSEDRYEFGGMAPSVPLWIRYRY